MNTRIKKFLSGMLTINLIILASFINVGATESISTKTAVVVTNESKDQSLINNLQAELTERDLKPKQKLFLNEINTKWLNSKEVRENSNIDVDILCINYELFEDATILDFAKDKIKQDKIVYYYGKNLNFNKIAQTFNLESKLPKKSNNNKPYNKVDLSKVENIQYEAQDNRLVYVGVVKQPWGTTLIKGFGMDDNFETIFMSMLLTAEHVQTEATETKVNQQLSVQRNTSNLTIVDHELWSLIIFPQTSVQGFTDLYLYQNKNETDATYDYFHLEVKTELDVNDFNRGISEFYQKINSPYSNDSAFDYAPKTQTTSGTHQVTIGLSYPFAGSVGYAYSWGGQDALSISTTYSQRYTYTETYYKATSGLFPKITHHNTLLGIAAYAPSAGYQYVDFDVSMKFKDAAVGGGWWYDMWEGPYRYHYSY